MLHARIRTSHDAFHFIAEVNPYNLQTLRQHVRQSLREDGQLKISVQIDPSDQRTFSRYTARWLPQLIEAGTEVAVDVSQSVQTPSAGAERANPLASPGSSSRPRMLRSGGAPLVAAPPHPSARPR